MKIIATGEGLRIFFTPMELAKIQIESAPTEYGPREIMETLVQMYSANLEQDIDSAIEMLDELKENAPEGGR